MKTIYKTDDGREFTNEAKAQKHQEMLDNAALINKDVAELLNQIRIKIQPLADASITKFEDMMNSIDNALAYSSRSMDEEEYYDSNC